jgi:hypothetical protein
MAKPILIVGALLPNQKFYDIYYRNLQKLLSEDYYCILYAHDHNTPHFQVFYEKDFNEVKYEELKQLVNDLIIKKN